jgi:prepilin-type N-terminal cleavage/methylation domain-containing protein/prepilin-type processing-associated H-X9-DG protein
MFRSCKLRTGFSLLELLVVVGVISVLISIAVPGLRKARNVAAEKVCSSNLRQGGLALLVYANSNDDYYPLEPTEHNSHRDLLEKLGAYRDDGLLKGFYCPKAGELEKVANNPEYEPKGDTDSVVDTEQNRQAGNISYIYWSYARGKSYGATGEYWKDPDCFFPRQLKLTGVEWLLVKGQQGDGFGLRGTSSQVWVMTDFFRKGKDELTGEKSSFPHGRKHARGLNVVYLDGHAGLLAGKPKDSYR